MSKGFHTNKKMPRPSSRKNLYTVDWYRGDWNYRTTIDCTWEDVKDCKRQAKLMGETIKYEKSGVLETY